MAEVPDGGAPTPALAECPHCGERVPLGAFCGNCGASLTDRPGKRRLHVYAAAPNEHVARPSVITTLFPHLPHRHAHLFSEALLIGVLIVVLLAALQLYTSALIAASLLLPILYMLYLYEVEVYENDAVVVIGATFVTGAALGTGFALLSGHLITGTINGTQQGPLISGVAVPLIVQLLMLAGPVSLLLLRSHFEETLDGLTFGVTSALGFTLALVIAGNWHTFTGPLQGTGAVSAQAILRLLRAGVLVAIVNGCTTGMITAVLWFEHHGRSQRRHAYSWRGLEATALVAFGAQVVLGLASYFIGNLLGLVLLWASAAIGLLVWLRVLLHHALLDEGTGVIGEASACSECHRLVPTMNFCPACGVHRSASPKRARPVEQRVERAPSHG
ncbi:MAG: hypothetical protein ABR498_03670 [Candidatus Dormibacteria bacterium]